MFDENESNNPVDNEQKVKEFDTLQLLVTAGYFRARIKGLYTFDKVVGGITWCIQGCSMNIDVDLLFQENLNIGRKIALTEKIVRVLKKMKCPHRIEPHQIQGSDFIHIYPVVQWLVKQTLASQDERMDNMKVMSCQYFDRNSSFNINETNESSASSKWTCNLHPLQDTTNIVEFLQKAYHPQRRYKKHESLKNISEEVSVVSTLLEYGRREMLASVPSVSTADSGNRPQVSSSEKSRDEPDSLDNLQNQMSSQVKESTKMGAKLVSKLLELKFGDIQIAAEEYETKNTMLMQSSYNKTEYWNKAISNLKSEMETLNENFTDVENQILNVKSKISEVKPRFSEKLAELNEIKEKIEEIVKNLPDNVNIEEIQGMVITIDRLKEEEQSLKAAYKLEDENLSQELDKLEKEDEPIEDEEKIIALQDLLVKEKKRLQNGRLRLAKKTRELKQLEIFLDDIPSKREIQQYQKRFVELNNGISAAFSENKQLFDMYNILDSVKDCLQREVNLLNSILDNFKESMQHSYAKEQIIQQMQDVANTIRDFKKNGENQKEKIKADRDQKKEEFNSLVDKSRQYAKLTKSLQETWQYYDKLIAKCNELGIVCPQ